MGWKLIEAGAEANMAGVAGPTYYSDPYEGMLARLGEHLFEADRAAALDSVAMSVQGKRAVGELRNVSVHLARLLARPSVGGQPSGEPPKKNERDDKHWWKEIKASMSNYFRATKGASRKQLMRELTKGYTESPIAEISLALTEAEALMGEFIGSILP